MNPFSYHISSPGYLAVTGNPQDAADIIIRQSGCKEEQERLRIIDEIKRWNRHAQGEQAAVSVTAEGTQFIVLRKHKERKHKEIQ